MNREIIFKAKRLDNGEWVEGHYVSYRGCCHFVIPLPFGGYIAQDNTFYAPVAYMVDPSTVCQYTGLTDKNGKKIFEGDIVKTTKYGLDDGKGHNSAGADTFTVVFIDGGYCLYNKWRRFNLRPDVDIEICGSIHDGEGGQHE